MNDNVFSVTIDDTNPEPIVQEYCKKLSEASKSVLFLLVIYPFEEYWLPGNKSPTPSTARPRDLVATDETITFPVKPSTELAALYCLSLSGGQCSVKVAVSDDAPVFRKALQAQKGTLGEDAFVSMCGALGLPYFTNDRLFEFEPISIPKPWGKEIWYTGIEERGVASFTAQGFTSPIPWVLSTLPSAFCGNSQRELILLKILDPYPDPAFGDLYFELHQKKREVYVVTAIDPVAWPSGIGAIRFGFDQAKRKEYGSDASFRESFMAAVSNYEAIRRKIDDYTDNLRLRDGIPENQLVDNAISNAWLSEVPDSWKSEELMFARTVETFTDKLSLSVGDVVKVPCLTPHSLQHGVRTIEFQTPVYERLIVSFNQKVQTQSGWDTNKAIEVMNLESVPQSEIPHLVEELGVKQEKIVEFEDFDVIRIEIEAGAQFILSDIDNYCLIIGISGIIHINAESLEPERASLLTRDMSGAKIVPILHDSACFLIAYPK
ncbi:MAG: hypothetical protein ACI92E_002525 [Oceanicoccus sp.]|jgi:hypothetical protein